MDAAATWKRFTAVGRNAAFGASLLAVTQTAFAQTVTPPSLTGAEIFAAACASCHGSDGRGAATEAVAFTNPLPDFTDCEFAPREPDTTWVPIIHGGGPARAFNQMMPAFGDAFTLEQIRAVLGHVRTLCTNPSWPRGDLNFPKALVTEKAFPEDEMLFTTTAALEGPGAVSTRVVYERRFGARTQMEFGVPVRVEARPDAEGNARRWVRGVGDIAVAVKRVLVHSLPRGQILSATAEVVVPTGSESKGLGGGTGVVEPFLTYGQLLPGDWFVQAQSGIGIPLKSGAPKDAQWRAVFGKSFWPQRFGRMWSPMIEVLAGRELVRGERTLWDVLPEIQVTLSTRQHIRANVGVRLPINDAATRSTQVISYLLWDWYDGPFFGGW